jgi:hypothetical protein
VYQNNRHDEAKQNDVGPKGARRQSEEEKKTTPKEMKEKSVVSVKRCNHP